MRQTGYVEKIAAKFLTQDDFPTHLPMRKKHKPSEKAAPQDEAGKLEMEGIPYREAIGSLIYLSICTRPDISYAVSSLAEFSQNPGMQHWEGVLNIIKYVKTTKHLGLKYAGPEKREGKIVCPIPYGYSDSSFKDRSKGRSTIGSLVYLIKRLISWRTKISTPVPQSVMEAEIIACNHCAKEIMWMRYLLAELRKMGDCSTIYSDSDGTVRFADDDRVTEATKHIQPKYYFVRDMQDRVELKVVWISQNDQIADTMTKPLENPSFTRFRGLMNVE
jgi:hypothetical protein